MTQQAVTGETLLVEDITLSKIAPQQRSQAKLALPPAPSNDASMTQIPSSWRVPMDPAKLNPDPSRRFGDTVLLIYAKMSAAGRAKGISIDPATRIATIHSPLNNKTIVVDIDNPSNREKITAALRLVPALYRSQAGSYAVFEDKVERAGSTGRYIDVSLRSRFETGKTLAIIESKICSSPETSESSLDHAKNQALDYARRLAAGERLADILAISLLVFQADALEHPDWVSQDYFNAQGSPSEGIPADAMAHAKELVARHGMACLTWLCDLRDEAARARFFTALKDGSLLARLPDGYTLPFIDEIPVSGKGISEAQNSTSAIFRTDVHGLHYLPAYNPAGASDVRNVREIEEKPVCSPGRERLNNLHDIFDEALRKGSDLIGLSQGYAGKETGSNLRRFMALQGATLWQHIQKGPKSRILVASLNCALIDGQSSTACFASMAQAASRSASWEDFKRETAQELVYFDIPATFLSELEGKLFAHCNNNEQRQTKFDAIKLFLLSAEFDVKLEFPPTQADAARSARAANLASKQSSADLNQYLLRAEIGALHDLGKMAYSKVDTRFCFSMIKQHEIERFDDIPISEIAQISYQGASANPAAFDPKAEGVNPSGATGVEDLGKKSRDKLLKGALACGQIGANGDLQIDGRFAKHDSVLSAHQASQALSRACFEGSSSHGRLSGALRFLTPQISKALGFIEPVKTAILRGLESKSAIQAIRDGSGALDAARLNLRKSANRHAPEEIQLIQSIHERFHDDIEALLDRTILSHTEVSQWLSLAYDSARLKIQKLQDSIILMNCAALTQASREQGQLALGQLDAAVQIEHVLFSRILAASLQFTLEDGALGFKESNKGNWEKHLATLNERLAFCAERLVGKLNHAACANQSSLTREELKDLGKMSLDCASANGGFFSKALPGQWAATGPNGAVVYQAHKSASVWLLCAGIEINGAWNPGILAKACRQPDILISE